MREVWNRANNLNINDEFIILPSRKKKKEKKYYAYCVLVDGFNQLANIYLPSLGVQRNLYYFYSVVAACFIEGGVSSNRHNT
jgi:hypothetical protein